MNEEESNENVEEKATEENEVVVSSGTVGQPKDDSPETQEEVKEEIKGVGKVEDEEKDEETKPVKQHKTVTLGMGAGRVKRKFKKDKKK